MDVKVGQKRVFKVDGTKFEIVKIKGFDVIIKELNGIIREVRLSTIEEHSILLA